MGIDASYIFTYGFSNEEYLKSDIETLKKAYPIINDFAFFGDFAGFYFTKRNTLNQDDFHLFKAQQIFEMSDYTGFVYFEVFNREECLRTQKQDKMDLEFKKELLHLRRMEFLHQTRPKSNMMESQTLINKIEDLEG